MRQRNSVAAWPAGRWPTIRSTGRPNAAASAAPIPAPSCGWSTTTATRSAPTSRACSRSSRRQLGPSADWIRTTDMARIDADGFLWILGRADQAIIRGGFKVMPDDVRTALESHPAVQGAAVVGRPDDRLGETPVAMVELRDGAIRRPRRAARLPANPVGALRDSHRHRDRRRDPADPVGQARPERRRRHFRDALSRLLPSPTYLRPHERHRGRDIRCWSATTNA